MEKILVEQKYIEEQYRIAFLDFKCAKTENEQWSCRKRMATLEHLAMVTYGFDYADKLHDLILT